jgi:hypothetical protein
LQTDGTLYVGNELHTKHGTAAEITLGNDGKIYWGSSFDTNLYRASSGVLKTDGQFYTGSYLSGFQGTAREVTIGLGSGLAGMSFHSSADTNLYRAASGELRTDNWLESVQRVIANYGTANQVTVGIANSAVNPGIDFGNVADTSLYRTNNGQLTLIASGGNPADMRMTSNSYPRWSINAASNGTDLKKWQCYVDTAGTMNITKLNDAESGEAQVLKLFANGNVQMIVDPGATWHSPLGMIFSGLGSRGVEVHPTADSGGAGYRMLRVAN